MTTGKERQKIYNHRWRQKHPEKVKELKEHNRLYAIEKRENKARVVRALKNSPCADCGHSYPYYVMDFDHRPGTEKKFNIGQDLHKHSLEEVVSEAAKCDVVCANCHRERTQQRR